MVSDSLLDKDNMASLSLEPAVNLDALPPSGPPRHGRKHSRHPTAAAPLPSFTFSPGSPTQEGDENDKQEANKTREAGEMTGSGHIRRPSKPAPLPQFIFNPGASMPAERTPSPTHPILEEMALNQQRVSKSAKPAPLPAFTFNPGAASGSTSPTKLDSDSEGTKHSGHRRGGSEFVGGKADNAQLVVASPVKPESKPSGPPVTGHAYRGHTHRRSQAISVSDIETSELIKQHALAKARAPSNPSTPQESTFSFARPSPGHRQPPSAARSPPGSPRRRGSTPGHRSRAVDFSERVDVIPRPLSMISSETELSNSTIRGHSVTNSINSIASPPPSSTAETQTPVGCAVPDASSTRRQKRPSTADAALLLGSTASSKDKDFLEMPKRPLSASGSPIISSGSPSPKKKYFWSTHGNEPSPTPTPKVEKKDPMELSLPQALSTDPNRIRPKTAPGVPSSQKRRKYHTWTAGIFSKKSKQRPPKKSGRSPTPPSLLRRDSDKINDIFDADDTVVLREDTPAGSQKQPAAEASYSSTPTCTDHSELTSPVIDLDAALSPSDDDRRHSDDNARTTTARIAKLHSSERRGVVDAFGVSHRRTESAPALSPVNRSVLFGMRHHGSNGSLSEDVFDEQEEDNFLAHEKEIKSHSGNAPRTDGSSHSMTRQKSGLGLSNLTSHTDDVVIVDPDEAEAEDVRSSKSTIDAPAMLGSDIPKRPSTSPMPFAYPDPQLHYASSTEGRTTTASLISSPDADHASFDVQSRPRRLGELNPDHIRPSNDDLPSLSDSVSSNIFPRRSCSGNARPSLEHRSNSMFVPGSSRNHEGWKRSSLASLNRLIPGSSHGSKLKLETLSNEGEEKTKKKTNRISKLMRFWRPKELDERPTTSA